MPTVEVANALAPHGLLPPDLEMLRPTEASYTSFLLQPSGPIFASQRRIGALDVEAASAKAKEFLIAAQDGGAHLAITPEYFMPWSALQEVIELGITPASGALWVLGCESTNEEELEHFKHTVSEHCLVVHEPWAGMAADRSLLDPVVLLFMTQREDGTSRLVALVQFKTFPSRDPLFHEEQWLRRGTSVYRFRGVSGHLAVAVIICSDALALNDPWLTDFKDRTVLIHIQLNPSPRNPVYRAYRKNTFETDARFSNCHIVCLNWAHSIVQHGDAGTKEERWGNVSASTWYCPADDCSCDDAVVVPNHKLGMYYAYMEERRHALLFHYDEALFQLRVPKLMTLGAAVMANRNGPVALQRYIWDSDTTTWSEATVTEAGFTNFLVANPHAQAALQHVTVTQDPLAVERVLALSAGKVSGRLNWHVIKEIDSCSIGPNEIVRRITFAQDPEGQDFRHYRVNVAAQIHHEILSRDHWPPQVAGINAESIIQWNSRNPNFNVLTADNQPTLVVYLGDLPTQRELENTADKLYELLRQAGGPHRKRFCVVYREFGQLKFAPIGALTRIDDPEDDKTDIFSVTPLDDAEAPL